MLDCVLVISIPIDTSDENAWGHGRIETVRLYSASVDVHLAEHRQGGPPGSNHRSTFTNTALRVA
ncbi:MAG: hypothetical protein KatS3mg111_1364 [Pirellulaceae bacterium]|nr:MAG: hypothetical protein KatS3mg111_1364 [Pirellulaceae bacterium]